MRVMIVVPRFHVNVWYRAKALQDAGHVVKVLALYSQGSERVDGVDVEVVGASRLSRWLMGLVGRGGLKSDLELAVLFPSVFELRRRMREFGPDVVVGKCYLDLHVVGLVVARFGLGVPVMLWVQTKKAGLFGSKLLLRLWLGVMRAMGVAGLASPTARGGEVLLEVFPSDRVWYVEFPVADPGEVVRRESAGAVVNVLCVGKFTERKGQMLLLEAVSLMQAGRDVGVKLVGQVADEAHEKNVRDLIVRLGLDDVVEVVGEVAPEEMDGLYREADVFVLPSFDEPASVSVVEAMSYGLPVVVADDCGTACYVKSGYTGEVFVTKDAVSLAGALDRVVGGDLVAMSRAVRDAYVRSHVPSVYAKRMDEIFLSLGIGND